jgi:hypothetical protein
MKRFATFLFCHLIFCIGKLKKENTLAIFWYVSSLLFSVRIVVESVKESQGGFESTLGLLSGSVVEYSFYTHWTFLYLQKRTE